MVVCAVVAYFRLDTPMIDAILIVYNVLLPFLIIGGFYYHICRNVLSSERRKLTDTRRRLRMDMAIEDDAVFHVAKASHNRAGYAALRA